MADSALTSFGKTRSAVAAAGVYKGVADSRIRADADAHLLDVGADAFRQIRQLVHEADLGREHRIGRVLRQLGRAHVHDQHAIVISIERLVEVAQQFRRARIVRADDDTIGLHEILDRSAFLQEFGVGNDIELRRHTASIEHALNLGSDLVRRPDGHGGLVDDDSIVREMLADGARDLDDVAQVGRAVLLRRRPHGDELHEPVRHAGGCIRRVVQTARLLGFSHDRLEPGLVDRQLAALQALDLVRVDIHRQHMVTGVRQARARHQADVARAENSHSHARYPPKITRRLLQSSFARRRFGRISSIDAGCAGELPR